MRPTRNVIFFSINYSINTHILDGEDRHYTFHQKRRMWQILRCFFLIGYVQTISNSMKSVGVIHNVSVNVLNQTSTIINGTCKECLCVLVINTCFSSSFNCFSNNNTCQVFSQSFNQDSFIIKNSTLSSFYFFSQVSNGTSLTTRKYRSFVFIKV